MPTSKGMDSNQNKIFDSLDSILALAAAEARVPVLVMAKRHQDLAELEKIAGLVQVKHRYKVVPALAADLTKEQIRRLAAHEFVEHIEHDAEVRVLMDGANRWFGTAKARADFGVTGSRDGSESGFSRDDVVVAVIDTGIDASHVDLAGGKVIAFNDWVNGRTTAYDDHGHGTHVAGIVAGRGQGNAAYTGVAPGAALVGLKVLNANGSGTLSDVTAAVDWAVEHKAEYNIRIISTGLAEARR